MCFLQITACEEREILLYIELRKELKGKALEIIYLLRRNACRKEKIKGTGEMGPQG